MTQERLTMRKIREVLRLKWECGLGQRAIARSCGIARSTVGDYLQRAEAAGLGWPLPDQLDDATLTQRLFPPPATPSARQSPLPDWSTIYTELHRADVTLRLLWVEYREAHPDGLGYSQFCELYSRWAKRLKPTMRQTHRAGEKVFVDYAGRTVPVIDPQTGEIRAAQVFVAALSASHYLYAEAHWHQDLPNRTGAHVRLFAYLGGVPEIVVPDNLKAGVHHPSRYEPDLNPTYQALAQHYGVAVIPARPRKPRDKAKAESGVQVVQRWILARLRDRTFFSLAELNLAIRELLDDLNHRLMRHLGRSRRELFELLDRPALRPLPIAPYEFALWKRARVHIDYHVEFDQHYYSVPHTLIHQEVFLRVTEHTVEVFHRHQRVASHPRATAQMPGRHTTCSEHMPENHRAFQVWSPERFVNWAQTIGPNTTTLVQNVLNSRRHPEQAYRSCLGLLNLAKRYSAPRLEAACTRALPASLCSYKGVKNILDAKLDLVAPEEPAAQVPADRVTHENLRGQAYYQ